MSADLTTRKKALVAYARSCLEAGDWHGCRDACTDLEVIDARLEERAMATEGWAPTKFKEDGIDVWANPPPIRYKPGPDCSHSVHVFCARCIKIRD